VKWFFDSSVLVAAFLPTHEHHARSFAAFAAAHPRDAGCAAHSLAEVYATLTRYPAGQRISGEQAAVLVLEIERRCALVWLDGGEYVATIQHASALGVTGGAVYDSLVGACALKARSQHLYTWNLRHFRLLGPEIVELAALPPAV
jgi:predicted nucleic acid-binding protein